MQNLEAFRTLLGSPQNIVITTHIKPDADALGSSLALFNYLLAKGHNVSVVTPSDYPDFLSWMPGNESVIAYADTTKDNINALITRATMIFCLDFSSLKRIEEVGEMVANAHAKKVLIDHHLDPEQFSDFALWDIKAAATAQLVYELILMMGDGALITPAIANCLYAGILTDTGSFKHSNTTAAVHRVVADLIEYGADVAMVNKMIYDNNSLNRLKLIGYALAERLVIMPDYKVAYFTLSKKELSKFDYKTGDSEGLVNYALSIRGIRMAAIIIEREENVRLSFRSFGDFSVNDLARDYFNGGGHKNAAGGTSTVSLEQTERDFIKMVESNGEKFKL